MNQLEKQYTDIIKDNKNELYRLAYSYVRNEQDALEVISEAAYKGYVSLNSIKDTKVMKSWLKRIVINEALQLIRNRKDILDDMSWLNSMASMSEDHDMNMDLYKAIDRLSDENRQIIRLRYLMQYSISEIAEIMTMNENTVKTRISRSMKKLKLMLGGIGYGKAV